MRIRLGYQGINRELREDGIFCDRTARLATINERGVEYIRGLYRENMADLLKLLEWNVAHGITFYRVSSGIAPHITNDRLLENHETYKQLVYSLDCKELRAVRDYIASKKLRITFHAEPYVVLSTDDPAVRMRSMRDIYYHYKLMKLLQLHSSSTVIVHGGGVYGDKPASKSRWIATYMELSEPVRARIALENDERSYNIEDVLEISEQVPKLPVVFDIFHYICHNKIRRESGLPKLPPPDDYMKRIIASWARFGHRNKVKMHLSEQKPDSALGAHSDLVETIPKFMINFPATYGLKLDLMIEAKANEQAVLHLAEKYDLLGKVGGELPIYQIYVLGDKKWAKRIEPSESLARKEPSESLARIESSEYKIIFAPDLDAIVDAKLIVAIGDSLDTALTYQSNHYMLDGIVAVEPKSIGRSLPTNVIVHGKLKPTDEGFCQHLFADTNVDAVLDSIMRLKK